jgi:hypothetical protein
MVGGNETPARRVAAFKFALIFEQAVPAVG